MSERALSAARRVGVGPCALTQASVRFRSREVGAQYPTSSSRSGVRVGRPGGYTAFRPKARQCCLEPTFEWPIRPEAARHFPERRFGPTGSGSTVMLHR